MGGHLFVALFMTVVISFQIISGQSPGYVYIGCFYDSNERPLDTMVDNLRDSIDWKALKKTIDSCAARVKERGYEYFAIQFYGECWSDKDAATSFAKVGPASPAKCALGVGTQWVNAVYKLVNLPACSTDLRFTSRPSSGSIHELTWCSSHNDSSPWLEMAFNAPTRITGIGIQGKYPDRWVRSFTMEYSEGEMFIPYRERGVIRTFQGNSNWYDLHIQWLVNPTEGQMFRVSPKTWHPNSGPICAHIRLFGCKLH